MISYKVEIYDSEDLRDWAINSGWSISWQIEKIDELDLWDEVYDLIDELGQLDSETDLNDMIRFGLDDMDFFEIYEEMNEIDDEDDDEEDE